MIPSSNYLSFRKRVYNIFNIFLKIYVRKYNDIPKVNKINDILSIIISNLYDNTLQISTSLLFYVTTILWKLSVFDRNCSLQILRMYWIVKKRKKTLFNNKKYFLWYYKSAIYHRFFFYPKTFVEKVKLQKNKTKNMFDN